MSLTNLALDPEIETVFLVAQEEYSRRQHAHSSNRPFKGDVDRLCHPR